MISPKSFNNFSSPQSTLKNQEDFLEAMTKMTLTITRLIDNYDEITHKSAQLSATLQRIEAKLDAMPFAKEEKI